MSFEEYIGNNIREVRKQKGMSQNQLADKSGFSNTAISNYETGRKIPSLTSIARIAKELEVSIDRLYYGNENETFITAENNKGRKIVNAIYYLWSVNVVSIPIENNGNNQIYEHLSPFYLFLSEYASQIHRLISSLDDFKQRYDTYNEPERYLEIILSSVANEINNVDSLKEKKENLKQKLKEPTMQKSIH